MVAAGGDAAVDVVRVRVADGVSLGPVARERLSRAHAIRPSCGLCGLASAEGLTRHLRPLPVGQPRIELASLAAMRDAMRGQQPLFDATGGVHAAAVFDAASGSPWAVREDVGRHNALDKALEALRLNVPVVASVSAPSSLAVELAEEHGLTLVCFLRGAEGRVYADDGRLG